MPITLPSKFEQDIQGRNTNLVPIVVIEANKPTSGVARYPESIFLSTQSLALKHISYIRDETDWNESDFHFMPLLLGVPSIKESIDIEENRKYKISNLKLNISNLPYNNGKRFSDIVAESDYISPSLKNIRVTIQWTTPTTKYFSTFGKEGYGGGVTWGFKSYYEFLTTNTFEEGTSVADGLPYMSFMAYNGIITNYKHDLDQVTLTVEDRTELDFHQDLPTEKEGNWLGYESNIPEDYRGQSKPMVYGYVDKSPCVIGANKQLIIDTKPLQQLNPEHNSIFGDSSPLFIGLDGKFISVTETVEKDLGSVVETSVDGEDVEVELDAVGEVQWLHSENNPYINLKTDSLLVSNNVLQCRVLHKAPSVTIGDRNDYDENKLTEDQLKILSDGDYGTGINFDSNNIFYEELLTDGGLLKSTFAKLTISTKPSIDDGLESRTLNVAINKNKLPVPQLVHGGGDSHDRLYIYPIENDTNNIGSYESIVAFGTAMSLQNTGDGAYDLRTLFGFSDLDGVNGYDNSGTKDVNITFLSEVDGVSIEQNRIIPALFFYDWCGIGDDAPNNGKYVIYFRLHRIRSSGGDLEEYLRIGDSGDFREVDVESLIDVENIINKNYYVGVNGRMSDSGSLLQKPKEIVTDIIRELKNDSNYTPEDMTTYIAGGIHDTLSSAFTIIEKTSSKDVIENILASTPFIGRFANNGQFRFNEIPSDGGVPSKVIKEEDIINFSFSKTENVYTKIIFKYKINYDTGEFEEKVEKNIRDILPDYDFEYYGLSDDHKDSTLVIDSEIGNYVRNKTTAEKFVIWLLYFYANSHLKMKIDLPISVGLSIEVGDVISFEKLIQGVKTFGSDYTQGQELNTQDIFPTFIVISTSKGLNKVSIECMQNHYLGITDCPDGYDECGVCGGEGVLDDCGVCDGDNSSCTDCNGVLNGSAIIDNCGECVEVGNECDIDCNGEVGGTASTDLCGYCTDEGTSIDECFIEYYIQANNNNLNLTNLKIKLKGMVNLQDLTPLTSDYLHPQTSNNLSWQQDSDGNEFWGSYDWNNGTLYGTDPIFDITPSLDETNHGIIFTAEEGSKELIAGNEYMFMRLRKHNTNQDIMIDETLEIDGLHHGSLLENLSYSIGSFNPAWDDSDNTINKVVIKIDVPDTDAIVSGTGDINGDGLWNVLDIVVLVNGALFGGLSDTQQLAADLNGDGNINVLDVVMLANCALIGNCDG